MEEEEEEEEEEEDKTTNVGCLCVACSRATMPMGRHLPPATHPMAFWTSVVLKCEQLSALSGVWGAAWRGSSRGLYGGMW